MTEEKIAVVKFKGDFLRTQSNWDDGKPVRVRLRNVLGMKYEEAVEKMSDAIADHDASYPMANFYSYAKVALDALLEADNGGKN